MKVIKLKNLNSIQYPCNAFINFTRIVINYNGDFVFYKNSKYHREDGPSENIFSMKSEHLCFYYNDGWYGDNFTIESWKETVKQLKREKRLNIFK
jgi:hypothetical protein